MTNDYNRTFGKIKNKKGKVEPCLSFENGSSVTFYLVEEGVQLST